MTGSFPKRCSPIRDSRFAIRGGALVALALAAAVLSACGFHLRGEARLPFDTISVASATPLGVELQRNITAGTNAQVVAQDADPQAVLAILGESREKLILSLNAQGRVREYELRYMVAFRAYAPKGGEYLPSDQIVLTRSITFNDQVLAKEAEEELLYGEMRSDMVQLIMRRLAAARLQKPE
ncbi:MAG TPA: LPS assembly lipoprotein LptE [Gemmatimonadaceae bacterium]